MSFFNACAVVLRRNDKFVLVHETRKAKAGLYNLPAGTLEVNEDVLSCAVREAQEETGIDDISLDCFMGVYEVLTEPAHNVLLFVFTGVADASVPLGSEEHDDVREYSYEELQELADSGQLRSPVVLQAITDYRDGHCLPLSAIHTWNLLRSDAITVPH